MMCRWMRERNIDVQLKYVPLYGERCHREIAD